MVGKQLEWNRVAFRRTAWTKERAEVVANCLQLWMLFDDPYKVRLHQAETAVNGRTLVQQSSSLGCMLMKFLISLAGRLVHHYNTYPHVAEPSSNKVAIGQCDILLFHKVLLRNTR